MTRRERMERRLEKRREWAAAREARSDRDYKAAHNAVAGIPLGQPILVGHHSERRHRRALERSDAAMGRAVESHRMAEHHRATAAGIAAQLDSSIFSDDADAIEQLEARIAEREAEAADHVAINRAWRKGGAAALRGLVLPSGHTCTEKLAESCERTMRLAPYLGVPLDTTNIRARIRRDRNRLAQLRREAAQRERVREALAAPDDPYEQLGAPPAADAAPCARRAVDGVVFEVAEVDGRIVVRFDRKPSDAVRAALRGACVALEGSNDGE